MTKSSIIYSRCLILIHEQVWFSVLEDPLLTSIRLDDIQLSGWGYSSYYHGLPCITLHARAC